VSSADQEALAARMVGIEQDKRRLTDIQRIRQLGSGLDLPLITEGRCPTCQQELDGRDVASGTVSTIEDNVACVRLSASPCWPCRPLPRNEAPAYRNPLTRPKWTWPAHATRSACYAMS
jgi:hypothetical protein